MRTENSIKSILLYGRSIRFRDSLIIGVTFGTSAFLLFESGLCSSALPAIPAGFLLLIIVPLVFLKLSMPVFRDIRHPRRQTISFIMGVSYKQRLMLGSYEIMELHRWILVFIFISSGIEILLNGVLNRGALKAWLFGSVIVSLIELSALSYGTVFMLNRRIIRSSVKDDAQSKNAWGSLKTGTLFISLTWGLAELVVSPLKKRLKAVAKRQITELFRCDPMNSIILPTVAAVAAVLAGSAVANSVMPVNQIIFIFAAYGIVLFNDESLMESSLTFSGLRMYDFSIREFFIANCYCILVVTIQIPVAYLVAGLFLKQGHFNVIGSLQFLNTYFYLILVAGCRYSLGPIPHRDVMAKYFTYGYPIVALPSLCIPVFGLFFPSALYAFLLFSEKSLFERTPFHGKCINMI